MLIMSPATSDVLVMTQRDINVISIVKTLSDAELFGVQCFVAGLKTASDYRSKEVSTLGDKGNL